MTVPTQPVTVRLADFGGEAVEGVIVRARMSGMDYTADGTFVGTNEVTATTDENGEAVLDCFPNAPAPTGLGTRGTQIQFTAQWAGSRSLKVLALVPDEPCNLVNILTDETPASLTDAEAAILQAQSSAAAASTSASAAADSAAAASASATAAAAAESAVEAHAAAAAASASAAADSADAAASSATAAANAAAASAGSASDADTSAGAAAESATDAQASMSAAAASSATAEGFAVQAQTDGAEQVILATAQAEAAEASAVNAGGNAAAAATSASESASSAADAGISETAAGISAASAATSAADAAAVIPIALGHADTAQGQAQLAQAYAADAASLAQQDLSGVTAVALHRSPNAIVGMCFYDPNKDTDGGAWIERCGHTTWQNEPLNGVWLGACATESAARAVSGATTGDYFQLTTDGKFYKLNASSGTTEVYRGNKAKFPRLAAVVAEAGRITIYDLTEAGRPMWMAFIVNGATAAVYGGTVGCLAMLQGELFLGGTNVGVARITFPADRVTRYSSSNGATWWAGSGIVERNTAGYLGGSNPLISGTSPTSVAAVVMPDAPVDPSTGLQVPTVALVAGNLCFIHNNGTVVSGATAANYGQLSLTPYMATVCLNGVLRYVLSPGTAGASFTMPNLANWAFGGGVNYIATHSRKRGMLGVRLQSSARLHLMRMNEAAEGSSLYAHIGNDFATGWQLGDVRRVWGGNIAAGTISNPSTIGDRCYKAKPTTIYGTLTATAVASGAQLVAYSGWSAANYWQEAYSAELDFGTSTWNLEAVVNFNTAVASTIADRRAASGAYMTLGTDATGKLTGTAYDGTTTRTVTTALTYHGAVWLSARLTYSAGTLALWVNGVQVASTSGTALLTLSNASAVATTGINYALDAPFPGSIAWVKWSGTVPTAEQAAWAWEQERAMFRAGAQVTLPDSGTVIDMDFDPTTERWSVTTASNDSSFVGLVRTGYTAAAAGTISKVASQDGMKMVARAGIAATNPGIDLTIPSKNMREELLRSREENARLRGLVEVEHFDATSSQTDFTLPVGWEVIEASAAGALKRESSPGTTTKDWGRKHDGFRETVAFHAGLSASTWVQVKKRRVVA